MARKKDLSLLFIGDILKKDFDNPTRARRRLNMLQNNFKERKAKLKAKKAMELFE